MRYGADRDLDLGLPRRKLKLSPLLPGDRLSETANRLIAKRCLVLIDRRTIPGRGRPPSRQAQNGTLYWAPIIFSGVLLRKRGSRSPSPARMCIPRTSWGSNG